jgi:hypothetical protein
MISQHGQLSVNSPAFASCQSAHNAGLIPRLAAFNSTVYRQPRLVSLTAIRQSQECSMSDLTFADLGLAQDLLRAVADTGYTVPTPIQAQAIPQVLQGGDLLAAAQTGTGKTAGFTLPLLQLLMDKPSRQAGKPRALVLTPRVNWPPRWKSRCANTANTCRSNPW